ncbi:YmfQ family protein [Paenibacillus sp. HWE-109]|uniref:YmfQ family protein n=1 Tax=Paenibacillus sp. HWE-109 TaxID=1306526 RepID=UPI001EDFD54D|nr:YmfQ family protein [Paenibacillus sp. HWE-109]UKS30145.1 YmfQ family protein [Paenibacillus sp. HWE-109]
MVAPLNPLRLYGEIRQSMSGYLPNYYEGSRIVGNLLNVEGAEVASLNANVADVLAQFYVDTATWGLANWERICGLPTDGLKPIEQRRSVIKSKLRGVGTVNAAMIKNVAEAYDNGEVRVTEDNAHYTVSITFISNHGVPANLADIQAALREIVPAHLAINFAFTYMTWSALDAHAFTWGTLSANNYTWAQFESLT